jgi:hypothetical protein
MNTLSRLAKTAFAIIVSLIVVANVVVVDGHSSAAATTMVNDTDPSFAYSSSGWSYSSGRTGAGDYQDDLHYTQTNGASVTMTFTGVGARVIGPPSGTVIDVMIDGVPAEPVSIPDGPYVAQGIILSVTGLATGEHTITVTKSGGDYLQIDALEVITEEDGPMALQAHGADNPLSVLPAAAGERSSGLSVRWPDVDPKHFFVEGFQTGRAVSWAISTVDPGAFEPVVLLQGAPGQQWRLSAASGAQIDFTTSSSAWERIELDPLTLAATDTITLSSMSGSSGAVKSLELLPEASAQAISADEAQFQGAASATRDQFSQAGWGLFFQYGPWSYPPSGNQKLNIDDLTDQFDVEYFADWVEGLGADYVVWSATWWTFEVQAPNAALDDIVSNSNRTAERDLLQELAEEFSSRDMMFFLYYHTGQDSHLGYDSTDFWQAQDFPDSFSPTGLGDRATFFDNWKRIVSEIGTDLGTDLDGWFFDDGVVYYPADFADLGDAARAGNPARLLSYNSWIMPSFTDYQDVNFAEDCEAREGADGVGGDGTYDFGPFAGLLEHCMIRTENDWGISQPNQSIQARYSAEQLANVVRSNSARNVPTTLGAMMWSPVPGDPASQPTISPGTIDLYEQMTTLLLMKQTTFNDTDPRVVYSPSEWTYQSGRSGSGDFLEDIHYTQTNGATATITFVGTGLRVLGPPAGTVASVTVDGEPAGSITIPDGAYVPQGEIYSVAGLDYAEHTVVLTKTGGQYLQFDAFEVIGESIAPEVEILADGGSSAGWFTAAPSVTISATDTGSGVETIEYRIGTEAWQPYTGPIVVGEGETLVGARAVDREGNESEIVSATISVDLTAPVVSGQLTAGRNAVLSATDGGSGVDRVEYSIDNASWTEYSGPVAVSHATSLTYRAIDIAGNVSSTESLDLTVAEDLDPTVTVSSQTVLQGGGFEVEVFGLLPGQQIEATVYSEPYVVQGIPPADSAGRTLFTVRIPASFASGPHRLVISGTGFSPVTIPITVQASGLAFTGSMLPVGLVGAGVIMLALGLTAVFVTSRRRASRSPEQVSAI